MRLGRGHHARTYRRFGGDLLSQMIVTQIPGELKHVDDMPILIPVYCYVRTAISMGIPSKASVTFHEIRPGTLMKETPTALKVRILPHRSN